MESRAPLPTKTASPEPEGASSNVVIAADIRKACGITESEAHFAYDSSRVSERERGIMAKLAACFTSGPLRDREMRLVGHADPRGDEEYNYLLGQRRADNVKGALTASGMTSERVLTTSRGELEASGQDEQGWAHDRRVDVLLGS